jgi:hypothetical protein
MKLSAKQIEESSLKFNPFTNYWLMWLSNLLESCILANLCFRRTINDVDFSDLNEMNYFFYFSKSSNYLLDYWKKNTSTYYCSIARKVCFIFCFSFKNDLVKKVFLNSLYF